jgi:polar amino acid transport system substrate-binding protein
MKRILFALCLILLEFSLQAQPPEVLRVGVQHEPPFVIMRNDGSFSGLSIDLWKTIASQRGVSYEFSVYHDHLGMIRALDFGEIDLCVNPMHVDEVRLKMLDVTQPFYVSSIGVATTEIKKNRLGAFLKNFFSFRFLKIVIFLLLIMLSFGTLLWMVEKKENRRQFRSGIIGLFDGLWWSAVTMTTVGYGDKAPKTKAGKIIAIIWMFTAIITISGFTGAIASTLTVQSLERNIEDLEDLRQTDAIASVIASSSEAFLNQHQIKPDILFQDVQSSLNALAARDMEVLVYDKLVLAYYITQLQLNNKVELLPVSFNQQYKSFFLPKDSPHFSWVNTLLVRNINAATWPELMREYNLKAQ